MNLRVFLGKNPLPNFKLAPPPTGELQITYVREDVCQLELLRRVVGLTESRRRGYGRTFPAQFSEMSSSPKAVTNHSSLYKISSIKIWQDSERW